MAEYIHRQQNQNEHCFPISLVILQRLIVNVLSQNSEAVFITEICQNMEYCWILPTSYSLLFEYNIIGYI